MASSALIGKYHYAGSLLLEFGPIRALDAIRRGDFIFVYIRRHILQTLITNGKTCLSVILVVTG